MSKIWPSCFAILLCLMTTTNALTMSTIEGKRHINWPDRKDIDVFPYEGGKSLLGTSPRPCPCKDASLCQRIKGQPKHEVFVFSVVGKYWRKYDWSKITTFVEYHHDDELMCYAHSKGVRLVIPADIKADQLVNATARTAWVDTLVKTVTFNFLDGVNVDFEGSIPKARTDLRAGMTALTLELRTKLKGLFPESQITYDFPYTPNCYDRYYDYKAITDLIDFMFIMAYDEPNPGQFAWANCAYNLTFYGIHEYIKYGLSPRQMVLGAPWYGYLYPCETFDEKNNECVTRGGRQYNYYDIVGTLLPSSFTGRLWDGIARSPFADIRDAKTGQVSQLWYDDPMSLGMKYALAGELGLRGVGMWEADSINYTDPSQVDRMWGVLP